MLLELKGIKKYFSTGKNFWGRTKSPIRAVDGVDLEIREGEHFGLVGESGSGKTTLGRVMLRLYAPDAGRIFLQGRDITSLSQRAVRPLRRYMQMVFQDPYSSLDPRYTVRNILGEGRGLVPSDQKKNFFEARLADMLKDVGLPEDSLGRFPHEFSGGERQRVAIARALMLKPKLLILDEAVSSLDVLIQEQILDLLLDLERRYALTYLFITHNLRVVKRLCSRVAVMYQGKIVESGGTQDIFGNPLHPYTQQLLSAAIHYRCPDQGQKFAFSENSRLIDRGGGHFVIN